MKNPLKNIIYIFIIYLTYIIFLNINIQSSAIKYRVNIINIFIYLFILFTNEFYKYDVNNVMQLNKLIIMP